MEITIFSPNKTLLNGEEAANEMNTYYSQVGKKLAEKYTDIWTPEYVCVLPCPPEMHFRFVGEKEVTSLVKLLKTSKSSHVKHVSTAYLKDALLSIIPELCHLINECLNTCSMPFVWKIGHITPIPKCGASYEVSNYRPISVLPAPSKLIERVVYNQLIYHLESYGLLDCRQHCFRRDHSTSSAIHALVQDMYNSIDDRMSMPCVFIDYSKAFDTLDHDIFCKKLKYYGIGENVISWCRFYLTHRKQTVKNGNFESDLADITCGVPQGSILGPLFFIIYVNDIIPMFKQGGVKILLYADDTVLYYSHKEPEVLFKRMNDALGNLWKWCKMNRLSVNTNKTKYMTVDPYRRIEAWSENPNLVLGDACLERVSSYSYLGVLLDDRLNFDAFLKEKCKKINMRVYQLGKMRKYIDSGIANTVYKQTVIPLFDYADFLVDGGPKYYRDRLTILHEKAIRIIDCSRHKNANIGELEYMYNLQSPSRRRSEHHAAIMYRQSKNECLLDTLRPNIHLRSQRKIKFKYPFRNMQRLLKSPLSRGIKIWDRIPQAIQRSLTKVKFKRALKSIHIL